MLGKQTPVFWSVNNCKAAKTAFCPGRSRRTCGLSGTRAKRLRPSKSRTFAAVAGDAAVVSFEGYLCPLTTTAGSVDAAIGLGLGSDRQTPDGHRFGRDQMFQNGGLGWLRELLSPLREEDA